MSNRLTWKAKASIFRLQYVLQCVQSYVHLNVRPLAPHAKITEQKDSRFGGCDSGRVSKQWPCCVTDSKGKSTGRTHHVYRVQGRWAHGHCTDWSRDVSQDRAHVSNPTTTAWRQARIFG